MKQVPLFGASVKSISPTLSAQRRVNCYFEVIQEGETAKIGVRGTPGLTLWTTLPTSPIRGWIEAGEYLYVVSGSNVYQVCQNGGYTVIGAIASTTPTPVSMAINETQVIIVDGFYGYLFNYALIQAGSKGAVDALNLDISFLNKLCYLTGNV